MLFWGIFSCPSAMTRMSSTVGGFIRNEAPDPFEPAALRVSPDFEAVAVKRVIVAVPVRKPKRQEFVRVHPDERYRLETAVVELAEERETYLVAPALHGVLADEVKLVRLRLAVPCGGGSFFWPVPLPGPDGRCRRWPVPRRRGSWWGGSAPRRGRSAPCRSRWRCSPPGGARPGAGGC